MLNNSFRTSVASVLFLSHCIFSVHHFLCLIYHPLALVFVCLHFSCCLHNQLFIPLLFHSIIPSFLFTGPSLPFPPLLSPLSLFNSPLEVNYLLWISFSISPSTFLISFSFVLRPCPILSSIRIYSTAGRNRTGGGRERRNQSDH